MNSLAKEGTSDTKMLTTSVTKKLTLLQNRNKLGLTSGRLLAAMETIVVRCRYGKV